MKSIFKLYLIFELTILLFEFSVGNLSRKEPQKSEEGIAIEDDWDRHRINQYEQLPVEFIGNIQRGDLDRIFRTNVELLAYNDSKILNATLFQSISKFMVPYELSNTNEEEIQMLKTLNMVTEYNSRIQNKGGKGIQVVISMTLKGRIIDDLNRVSNIINKTNTKLPGTIFAVFLHYGSLRLNSESIPFIREDVESCNRYVKTFVDISNVTCGFIFDGRNCVENYEKLKKLGFLNENIVIFDPREKQEDGYKAKILSMISCMLQMVHLKIKLGVKQLTPVTVNLKTGRFYRIPRLHGAKAEQMKYYVQDIELGNDENKTQPYTKANDLILSDEWLRRPLQLNQHHFGVTIHPTMNTPIERMLPVLFGTFRTIVLECPADPSTGEMKKQYDLAERIVFFVKHLTSTNNAGIPVRVVLSVTIYYDNRETNNRIVDRAMAAAKAANAVYPGVVDSILFNWNSCLKSEFCQPINDQRAFQRYVNKHFLLLESAFLYAMEKRGSDSLKLGISMAKSLLYDSFYYTELSDPYYHLDLFNKADLLVYKVAVGENELLEQGALTLSQSFLTKLGPLKSLIETLNKVKKLPSQENVMYQIKIAGCEERKESEGIVREQTRVAEYARFWEITNNWAVFKNTSIVIDTAFEEYSELSPKRKCSWDRNPFKEPKGCICGWWRVTGSESSKDGTTGQDIIMTDKKTIAVQFQEAKLSQKLTPPPSRLNAWNISMYIFLAVLITIAVSAFAAYLGQRHRNAISSNSGLTRKDLNGFFKGNATQLSKLVDNIHGGSSGHADSQPYKKDLYELNVTSFKIGHRCLGKGEFGVVYSCTLIRDEVEKLVAVKMINNSTHSSGNQAHGRYLALKGLISEIKLMSYVGEHVHLVKLEGAYTAKLNKGEVMVFTEYCELGSLENYLRNCAVNGVETTFNNVTEVLPSELSTDLIRWAGEIALGMEFLASKNVVHADLATRNVLLSSQKCAKISDFGLSRRLYDYTEYLKTEQGPLPWRWMAPESLRRMIFNEKTDVWSYGVTLWEMYTLGDMPYPGFSWDVNFPAMLEDGIRLHEPRWNEKNMYSIMKKCWEKFPDDRSTFSEIYLMITNII